MRPQTSSAKTETESNLHHSVLQRTTIEKSPHALTQTLEIRKDGTHVDSQRSKRNDNQVPELEICGPKEMKASEEVGICGCSPVKPRA